MLSITIMRDESASQQLSESGGSRIIASFQGVSPRKAARVNPSFIDRCGVRNSIARRAVRSGDRCLTRIQTAFHPSGFNPERVAPGDVLEITFVARRPIPDTSAEQSPRRRHEHEKAEAALLPMGPCARVASSCPHDGSLPLAFEASKLRSSGSAGIGIGSSVAGGLPSRQVGQARQESAVRPCCLHICY